MDLAFGHGGQFGKGISKGLEMDFQPGIDLGWPITWGWGWILLPLARGRIGGEPDDGLLEQFRSGRPATGFVDAEHRGAKASHPCLEAIQGLLGLGIALKGILEITGEFEEKSPDWLVCFQGGFKLQFCDRETTAVLGKGSIAIGKQQDVVIGAADVVLAGGDDRITGSAVAVSVGVAGPSDQIFDTLSFFD
ncbi:MAG: hypothetical protein NTW51_04065 [Cyanobacteria bacterium]|nr:hypothetical protein [Cyanobacteriota bacterium]